MRRIVSFCAAFVSEKLNDLERLDGNWSDGLRIAEMHKSTGNGAACSLVR
jgi:hypothetical protein